MCVELDVVVVRVEVEEGGYCQVVGYLLLWVEGVWMAVAGFVSIQVQFVI